MIVRSIGAALAAAVVALLSALAWLKWHESELVFATERSRLHLLKMMPADAQRIAFPTRDGTMLAGLIYPARGARTDDWILLLHGNADSAFSATQVPHGEALAAAGFSVLAFDYRGFGESAGVASEMHMDEDAEAALETLVRRGVALDRIIVLGHSLGSGPAVVLAVEHRVAALVLFGAFTSIPDAAVERYRWLPVRHLVAVRFDSLARIGAVRVPVIIAHSPTDRVIPYRQGARLFAAAREPKRFLTLDMPRADRFGGHVDGLFVDAGRLRTTLATLLPDLGAGTPAPGIPSVGAVTE